MNDDWYILIASLCSGIMAGPFLMYHIGATSPAEFTTGGVISIYTAAIVFVASSARKAYR